MQSVKFISDPAKVTQFSLGPNTVMENHTFTISCAMEGNPDPIWSIMNNRTKTQMMSGNAPASTTLTSWPARCEDAGLWVCTGHNRLNHGRNASRGGNITVLCKYYHIRLKFYQTLNYNKLSMTHPTMARLPWLIRTRF